MKKCCMLLCLAAVLFSMTACGNNDVQAQTSVDRTESDKTESSMEERTPMSETSEELENEESEDEKSENVLSGDTESAKTKSEGTPESDITDGAENMTGLAAAESEAGTAPEMGTAGADAGTRNGSDVEGETVMNMNVQVGDAIFSAVLEENEAVTAFVEMMREGSVVIQMSDYSGFEKVGPLGTSLPADNSQTTTHAGDIVLYNGNQIVIFYGSNSWSYTRLGHIDDLAGWEEALGDGDVTVTFSLE